MHSTKHLWVSWQITDYFSLNISRSYWWSYTVHSNIYNGIWGGTLLTVLTGLWHFSENHVCQRLSGVRVVFYGIKGKWSVSLLQNIWLWPAVVPRCSLMRNMIPWLFCGSKINTVCLNTLCTWCNLFKAALIDFWPLVCRITAKHAVKHTALTKYGPTKLLWLTC